MADVLVVEDDGEISMLLELVFAGLQHTTRVVGDAESALVAVMERRPDLLVLDIGLPGRDGDELLDLLMRGAGAPRALLIVSARPAHEVRALAAEHGAQHVTKPFEVEELEERVAEALAGPDGRERNAAPTPEDLGTLLMQRILERRRDQDR